LAAGGAGTAAQRWRRLEEIPNALPPKSRRSGTTRPMRGPATYQGQGWESTSGMREGVVVVMPIYRFWVEWFQVW